MFRGFLLGVVVTLLLASCAKRMSYDQLDATRVNAVNGLARANAAIARVEELEDRVAELELRLAE